MFVCWKAVRGEYYAQLEKRIWENGKVKTKVIAYLGKDPFDKLMAMGKITVAEVAQINYREKPIGYQELKTYALVMECKGTPWANISYLEKFGISKNP